MKNMTESKNKIYTLITLVVIIGFLAFLQSDTTEYSYQVSILERSAIYAVAVVFMDLLTDFADLFSLGQAGFMAIGAYVVAIFTIPVGSRASVYYVGDISPVIANIRLSIPMTLLLGGLAAAAMAALIGIPILCLKGDYLVIVILGLSKVIRVSIAAPMFDTITNGPYGPKSISGFPSIFVVFVLTALCIALAVLLINSPYSKASELIRGDKVAAQSMGTNLPHYKEPSFVISSFLTGVEGGTLVISTRSIDSKTFQVALTYDILLIAILDDIGSVTGSVAGAFLVTTGREPLHFFDGPLTIVGVSILLFRSGFRMVIFSIPLMAVVLFYRYGIMGDNEFSQDGLFRFIQGIPDRFKGGRRGPSSAKKGSIHQ